MKLYLNSYNDRIAIVPKWVNTIWQRKLWCFFHGHETPKLPMPVVPGMKITCGICTKILANVSDEFIIPTKDQMIKWNDETITWSEFCDRLEGKLRE